MVNVTLRKPGQNGMVFRSDDSSLFFSEYLSRTDVWGTSLFRGGGTVLDLCNNKLLRCSYVVYSSLSITGKSRVSTYSVKVWFQVQCVMLERM